ncbi:MAG: VWA domain-containing protein [Bacteroidetes bacterium]|uniref:VWA domain-containing protein n=1 Tax=Candidatus Pullibacteroides excrementavium TaxID=2840905 RepID=A0A9D9DU34_9BACT|nr:VWA domain-containing protein [Candidatus Pullibacteroides excrementavium]
MDTSRVAIARKTMTLFFLVDTSGSMYGEKIGSLNEAVRETIPDLNDLSVSNPDAAIKIAALQFDSDVKWLYPQPIEAEKFQWNDLQADGVTALGGALDELNSKLSKSQFMQEAAGSYAPVIILLSDGGPTDDFDAALERIKKNNWFKHAIKVAIAIGNDADKNVLAQFAGTSEAVFEVHNKAALRAIIKFVSVTSSQVNSKSSGVEDASKQQKVIEQVQDFVDTNNIEDVNLDEFN